MGSDWFFDLDFDGLVPETCFVKLGLDKQGSELSCKLCFGKPFNLCALESRKLRSGKRGSGELCSELDSERHLEPTACDPLLELLLPTRALGAGGILAALSALRSPGSWHPAETRLA